MARIIHIDKLKLIHMLFFPVTYGGLADGLLRLPLPELLTIKRKKLTIPQTVEEFADSIVYGQRLYFSREEPNDMAIIIRMIGGYYQPIITKKPFDDQLVQKFVKKVLNCKAKEAYPVAMHMIQLVTKLAEKEKQLLHREPTKIEIAAGIEKLAPFSELQSIDFLRDAMKITTEEVLQTPYNECLVRFMNAKAVADFQERLIKLSNEAANATKPKTAKT